MRLPLRLRVTLGFAVGMAVLLGALGAFLYSRVGTDLLNALDMELRSRAQVVIGAVVHRSPGLVRAGGHLIDPDEAFAQVLGAHGGILDSSSAVAGAPMLPPGELSSLNGPTFFFTRVRGVDDPSRILAVPRSAGAGRVFVVVGATLGDRNEALGRLLLALGIGGPIALALVSVAGWLLVGAALRPVESMRREAAAITLSEPARRLPVSPTGDELTRLASTLNEMLDRLQEAIQKEQRFLDQASHELRTPLGVLKMELDLALSRARSEEELKSALQNASAETDRLVRLAEHLLVLSRTRGGKLEVHRQETSVTDLLNRTGAAHGARAHAAGVGVRIECPPGLDALLDSERVRQALDDLLDNSLRHCPPGGTITLSAERSDGRVRIAVRDTGPGFDPDVLSGNAGNGEANEAGLGLAMVRAIAEAHGGALRLENTEGGGATATLDIHA